MNIFISYSRKDYEWVTRIRTYLKPLVNSKEIMILSDMNILPGQNWDEQIKKFIDSADIAIILISPSYLASNFLCEFELSSILKLAQDNKIKVIPILIKEASIKGEILAYDFLNPLSQPLALLSENKQNIYLKKLLHLVKENTKITNNQEDIVASYLKDFAEETYTEFHNIFYGSGENIFIQAERELESNK